jgi:hypothetical protein
MTWLVTQIGRKNCYRADKKDTEGEQVAIETCANEGRYTASPLSFFDRQDAHLLVQCLGKTGTWFSGLDTANSLLALHNP